MIANWYETFSWPLTTELYDPDTGTFSVMDHLGYGLEEPKLALQADGGVFVSGTVQGTPGLAGLASPTVQSLSGSTLPMLGSLLLAQVVPMQTSVAYPEEAALRTKFAADLAGGHPRQAVISIPLPDNADLTPGTTGTEDAWIGENQRARSFLIRFAKPVQAGRNGQVQVTGIGVKREALDSNGAVVHTQWVLGGEAAATAQPLQTSIFDAVGWNNTGPITPYVEPVTAIPDATERGQEISRERIRKQWALTWLPVHNPGANAGIGYYRVRVTTDISHPSTLRYGLIGGQVVSPPGGNQRFTFRIFHDGSGGYTDVNVPADVTIAPHWTVEQFFSTNYYSDWNNDKWTDKKTFDWLSVATNRQLLEPLNDITLEHGRNTGHAEHRNGNQADLYHPGYGVFINSTGGTTATTFTSTYLVPMYQQAAGWTIRDTSGKVLQTVAPDAQARTHLIQWLTRARSRIEGYMSNDTVGQYSPVSYRYLTSATVADRVNGEAWVKMMLSCSMLRDLMLKGACINLVYTDEGTGNITTYSTIDLTNDIGTWNVNKSPGVVIADPSPTHTNHMHVNWGQKGQAFLNNGSNH